MPIVAPPAHSAFGIEVTHYFSQVRAKKHGMYGNSGRHRADAIFHHTRAAQLGQKHDLAPGVTSLKHLERLAHIAQREGRCDWHFQLTGGN
jgi:hypothetical protein